MASIKTTFERAACGTTYLGVDFWMIVWALVIMNASDRRERDRRKKREDAAKPQLARKPHRGPRP